MLRGVGLASVAAVAVTGGAVALTGSGEPELATQSGTAALAPSPVAAVVPAPAVPVAAADTRPLETPVLGTTMLADAVAQAQDEARRLADEASAREAEAREAAERADRAKEKVADDERAAEQARRVARLAEPDAAPTARADCGLDTGRLGAVKPFVRTAAEFLGCAFGEPTVLGVAGRGNASDHPSGRALDFMVDRATGDQLAACAIRNREALGISYVIWRQRIDTGSGFRAMPDRGGPTANHFDHVHVSFEPGAGSGAPVTCSG